MQYASRMKLHQMKAFHAVATLGTVTRAATALRVSQPAISRTIRLLEEELGLSLFDTLQGRLVPTAQANALLPEVGRILAQIQDLGRHATDLREGKRGVLRIASAPSGVLSVVKAGYDAFNAAAPGALLDVTTARTSSVVDMVAAGHVDLGFCQLNGMEKNIVSHVAIRGGVVCVMPEDHPLANRSVLTPEDLANEKIISYSDEELTGKRIANAFAQAGVPPRYAMQISQTLPAINLVSEGFGVALIDSFFSAGVEYASAPQLPGNYTGLRLVPFAPTIEIDTHLLTQGATPLSYLAEIFIDAVLERFS